MPIPMLIALPETSPTYDYKKIIIDLFEHINDGDIIGFANCFAPNVRESQVGMASSEWNKEHGEYYYNFKYVNVLEITQLHDRYCRPAPDFSTEIDEELLLDTDNFDCFYVKIDLNVFTPDGYYSDGELELNITILKEDGKWYVSNVAGYCPEHYLDPTWMKFIDNYYDNLVK